MRYLSNLAKIVLVLLVFAAVNLKTSAQWKPDPIKSATLDMLVGTWMSEPYEMMGGMHTTEATHSVKHNGQYLFIEIKNKDDKNYEYTGTIVILPKSDGTFTGYGFGDYGGVTNYSGKFDGNKIHAEGKSEGSTEVRDIEVNGNNMVQVFSFTFKDKTGKEMTYGATVKSTKK